MKNASNLIPDDLQNFLATNEDRRFTFERNEESEMEVDSFEFYAPNEVKLSRFTIDTYEYHLNHNETGNDPELRYDIQGVDLIRDCGGYEPEGILIYIPEFQEYGSWDCDHGLIAVYPNVGWSTIETRLVDYVNAQWYPQLAEQYLLRPWADDRCSKIKPYSSR